MKSLFAVAAFMLAFGFISCKKVYTCECTSIVVGQSIIVTHDLGKQTKKEAENLCYSKAVLDECELRS